MTIIIPEVPLKKDTECKWWRWQHQGHQQNEGLLWFWVFIKMSCTWPLHHWRTTCSQGNQQYLWNIFVASFCSIQLVINLILKNCPIRFLCLLQFVPATYASCLKVPDLKKKKRKETMPQTAKSSTKADGFLLLKSNWGPWREEPKQRKIFMIFL